MKNCNYIVTICLSFFCWNCFTINLEKTEYPGFKTVLSQSGLSYFQQVGISLLELKLHELKVPDQSGTADTVIGKVDWSLSGISVSNLQIASSSLVIVPGVGITLSVDGISIDLSSSWKYRKNSWPHVNDHGTADVIVSSTNVVVTIRITESKGLPVVSVTSDSVNIGNLDIKLHGGASWLYNFFIGLLKGTIVHAIDKALADAVTKNIDDGVNHALSTLPVTVPVNHQVEINYEMLQNPVFSSAQVTLYQLGEFYSIVNSSECPAQYCPTDSLPDEVSQEMVQMIIGDYVANSAGYVFFERGDLKIDVHENQIPSWSPVQLNTSSWKYILPELTKVYPNNLMVLSVYSTEPPVGKFTPNGASVYAVGRISVDVILNNGSIVPAFVLQGFISMSGEVLLNGKNIYGNLTYLASNFSLANSNIGPFDVSVLVDLINIFLSKGIVPVINKFLANGFALPTIKGLTFISPSVGWGNGFVYISTNVHYVPNSSSQNHIKVF
jgi:lipopolysaccharide-binding protein